MLQYQGILPYEKGRLVETLKEFIYDDERTKNMYKYVHSMY